VCSVKLFKWLWKDSGQLFVRLQISADTAPHNKGRILSWCNVIGKLLTSTVLGNLPSEKNLPKWKKQQLWKSAGLLFLILTSNSNILSFLYGLTAINISPHFVCNEKMFFFIKQSNVQCFYIGLCLSVFYTDISCLGGAFPKNTSRETKNFPSRMAREI
jgi:hypothetical protein